MEQKKIANLISTIRKEKGLTQEELGNLLGVSSKTISKWECANGLPDITILKKISELFEITIEELLNGEVETKEKNIYKNNNKIKNIILIVLIPLITVIIILISSKTLKKEENNTNIQNNCTVIKTYDIKNIGKSNDGNYLYVTISEYQVEGVFTIKLPKSVSEDLKKDKAYVFTFKTNKENIDESTDLLFNNSEIINIKETDKLGMERESRNDCNN